MRLLLPILFLFYHFAHSQAKLTITEAIKLGKVNNPYSKLYQLNLDVEKADLITSGIRPNILLNQQSIFMVKQSNLDAVKPNQNLFISPYGNQLWFQATKQFQINGKRLSKIKLKEKEIAFAEQDINTYTNEIAYNTAQKWLEVWYAKVKLQILTEARENVDTLLKINKIRLKNQVITSNELSRTQLISDQYSTQLKAAQQTLSSEIQKLSFLVGSPNIVDIDSESDFFFKDVPDSLFKLIELGVKKRPEIASKTALIEISEANIQLQKSLSIPNLELGLVFNPQNTQPYVGWYSQMPLPIFDKNQGNIQRSKIENEQNKIGLEVLKTQINSEISYTFQEYETYRDNTENYRLIVENADAILKTIRFSYLRGGTTIVDYLLAQQNWLDVQKDYFESLYLYRKSYLNILYSTGTLFEN